MKCQNCSQEFNISDKEAGIRKKVSPMIAGKTFELPEPEICSLCREQNRIAFRNERKLYKRKCSICHEEIVSVYSPDKDYKVACRKCFWSDKNDPTSSALEYDHEKNFFEQFDELLKNTHLLSLFAKNMENSDYANQEEDDKNCYLTVGGHFNEDCCYSTYSINGYKNLDCYFVFKCQNLYESMFCNNCSDSQYLENSENCSDCQFCESCTGCTNCFGSVNLNHKKYFFFNKELSEEDYKKKVAEALASKESVEDIKQKFKKHTLLFPKKFAKVLKCESVSGDDLTGCKNMIECYSVEDSEDSAHLYLAGYMKDCMDTSSLGWAEKVYNVASSTKLSNSMGLTHCISCPDSFYCSNCQNSSDLFGCVGMNHKQYCILNKQYTKDEYFQILDNIIAKMVSDGDWGKFFPMEISPFGYNETVAMEYFPLTKEEADRRGLKWQNEDFGLKYEGPFYEPKEITFYNPGDSKGELEIEQCINGILKCQDSGRPYKILPQEIAYYIEHNIQIPRKHPDQRHLDRLRKINPWKLYHRKCMNENCSNEFETTYAPDRPEKIYCETCYQKELT